jgi:hypothetical protein
MAAVAPRLKEQCADGAQHDCPVTDGAVRPGSRSHGGKSPDTSTSSTIHRCSATLPINRTPLWLHRQQDGRCAICNTTLLAASDRPQTPANGSTGWPPLARRSTSSGTQPTRTPLHPVSPTSTATPASHQGLLEPDAGRPARPVLRRARRRKAPGLSDERTRPPGATSDEHGGEARRSATARRVPRL